MGKWRKVCRGKKKFTTRNGAAGWAVGKKRFFRRPYRAYRCEFCSAWHVDAMIVDGKPNTGGGR
jgi:hypothetical protein